MPRCSVMFHVSVHKVAIQHRIARHFIFSFLHFAFEGRRAAANSEPPRGVASEATGALEEPASAMTEPEPAEPDPENTHDTRRSRRRRKSDREHKDRDRSRRKRHGHHR